MEARKNPPGAGDVLRLSYSRLQSFGNCKAQYRFHYLDKLPESGISIEAYLGRRLHAVLEWLYSPEVDRPKPTFDEVIKQFRDQWVSHWDGSIFIARAGWATDDYYQLGQRALAGYYRRHAPFNEPVVAVEKKYTFSLDGAPQLSVVGIIDRLDQEAPGHWSIHDYKSGKRMLSSARAATDLQMQIYFLALLANEDHVDRVDVVWHYLQHGKRVELTDVQWDPQRLQGALVRKGRALLEAQKVPDNLLPKESPLCSWCHYWEVCPAKRGQTHPARRAE